MYKLLELAAVILEENPECFSPCFCQSRALPFCCEIGKPFIYVFVYINIYIHNPVNKISL
ncbi:hypothetical protein SLEP1_g51116 [Rubroshorea leprosula]|uniref:Uncharacterized protein n=1 Tax=Rubroshorea leprosula TaxID=152421 RepID=A0AAV5M254_9ROSI|nr:hypothetical protein SLEP1_g51116 [Rubroshorea leprosula]